jgi:hypothetical protein
MNGYLVLVYFVCFALIAGAAFALMWGNIQSINKIMDEPPKPRHPEAPEPGDEVMYVDFSRDKLEELYNQD